MRWFFFDLWRNLWETLRIASCDGGFSWISWSSISISISLNFWINRWSSTAPPLLSQGNHEQSSILCLHRCSQLDNRSLSTSKLNSTMLFWTHSEALHQKYQSLKVHGWIRFWRSQTSIVKLEHRWRRRVDDCWWFSWERRRGVVDTKGEWDGNRRRGSGSLRNFPRRVCAIIYLEQICKEKNTIFIKIPSK